jgi:REP element-mobilizing transposase RayT
MPSITPGRERLHSYLGGIVKGLGGTPLAIGGSADHVHLLIGIKSSHRLDYFLRDLKADSSEWIHRQIGKPTFAWQKGTGRFLSVHQTLTPFGDT